MENRVKPLPVCATCAFWTKRGQFFGRCIEGITDKVTHFTITNEHDNCPKWEDRNDEQ